MLTQIEVMKLKVRLEGLRKEEKLLPKNDELYPELIEYTNTLQAQLDQYQKEEKWNKKNEIAGNQVRYQMLHEKLVSLKERRDFLDRKLSLTSNDWRENPEYKDVCMKIEIIYTKLRKY